MYLCQPTVDPVYISVVHVVFIYPDTFLPLVGFVVTSWDSLTVYEQWISLWAMNPVIKCRTHTHTHTHAHTQTHKHTQTHRTVPGLDSVSGTKVPGTVPGLDSVSGTKVTGTAPVESWTKHMKHSQAKATAPNGCRVISMKYPALTQSWKDSTIESCTAWITAIVSSYTSNLDTGTSPVLL